jgi:hypothetical protein
MNKAKSLWARVPDGIKRVIHTFWQAAGGALFAGLITAKSTADVKLAVGTAVAVGLAAAKAALTNSLSK